MNVKPVRSLYKPVKSIVGEEDAVRLSDAGEHQHHHVTSRGQMTIEASQMSIQASQMTLSQSDDL